MLLTREARIQRIFLAVEKEATALGHRLFLLAGAVLLTGCATQALMRPPLAAHYAEYDRLGGNCPSAIVTPQLGISP